MVPTLALYVHFRGRGFRWKFEADDGLEVFLGSTYVGTVPGRLVVELIGHHLAGAELQRQLGDVLAPGPRGSEFR
jgi:hypothetical protein